MKNRGKGWPTRPITTDSHLHLQSGQPDDKRSIFEVEGLTEKSKGVYQRIGDEE